MFRKLLLRIDKRTRRLAIIGAFLLLVVVLFPFPISKERLTNKTWCAPSVRNAHFQFAERGAFQYGAMIVDAFDSSSVGGNGTWELSGTSIKVIVDRSNIHDKGYSFTIRPMLLGYALWSTVDFGGATILLPIWRAC